MAQIITKILEKIGAEAFERYSIILTEFVSEEQGIYALYKDDELYYIGKSTGLEGRIKKHLADRHRKKWDKFSLFVVKNESHIPELESLLITIAEPNGNKNKPKGKAKDLFNDFDRACMEYDDYQRFSINYGEENPKKSATKNLKLYAVYKGKKFNAFLL